MPKNFSDRAADATTAQTIDLLRLAATHLRQALATLQGLTLKLVGWIRGSAAKLNRLARLADILREAKLAVTDAYKIIVSDHTAALKDMARTGVQGLQTILTSALGINIFTPTLTEAQLAALASTKILFGNSAADWWNLHAVDLKNKLAAGMQHGLAIGESTEALIARVEGTADASFQDGLMAQKQREAAILTRTAAVGVANELRLAGLNGMSDAVDSIVWISTLDSKTCKICAALSGLQWTVPGYEPIGHEQAWPGNLAHLNCRCHQAPVLKSWGALAGQKIATLDNMTIERRIRAALFEAGQTAEQMDRAIATFERRLDGKAAVDQTFDEWLSGKSPAEANKILGPGRYALWEAGMPLAQMIDQNNRPLTLEELRAKWDRERK